MFEEMGQKNPSVSFVHAYPGFVKTGFAKDLPSALRAANELATTILSWWAVGIEESGQRHLYAATSAAYPPKAGETGGVEVSGGGVAKGSAGMVGSGAYLIGSDNEVRANEKVLRQLRSGGAGEKIWAHTMKTFEDVRGS